MTLPAATPDEYELLVPADRRDAFARLRQTILQQLPTGFEETMSYGMIGYVVPKSIYPAGYHCNTQLPLPFASIASQKNSINFYHMGLYAQPDLYKWFIEAYASQSTQKIDMGKSCVRFKKVCEIPYELIGELMQKVTVQQWIEMYETAFRR